MIHALNGDKTAVWTAPESWPIVLSLGSHLIAEGVTFLGPDGGTLNGFCVAGFDADDRLEVSITGDETADGSFLKIGPARLAEADSDVAATLFYAVNTGGGGVAPCALPDGGLTNLAVPLRLSNVWITAQGTALVARAGATVTLGPWPVWLGNGGLALGNEASGNQGIYCIGQVDRPSTVQDIGFETVRIDSMSGSDVEVDDYCSVSLTHGPILGTPPDGGLASCKAAEGMGAVVGTFGSLFLGSEEEPALVQCTSFSGIVDDGLLSFEGTIRNTNCFGLKVQNGGHAGLATATFVDDHGGIWLDDGVVDLSGMLNGFQTAPPSDLACTTLLESEEIDDSSGCEFILPDGGVAPIPAGAGIANTSATATVNARNSLWNTWDPDAGMPQVWNCSDFTLDACTCHGPGCVDGGGISSPLPAQEHFSAIYYGDNPNPFDFSGGGLAPESCGQFCSTIDAGSDGGAKICQPI